jgi:nitrite reductase/ring-hydroxylating ferredoxin subunit
MTTPTRAASPICPSDDLAERRSYGFRILYRGTPRDAILIRFRGVAYAYLNRCVHMPRRLDGEAPRVFDAEGRYLRCTMHGIVYDPVTGLCQSEICADQSLTPIRIAERGGTIYLADKRAELAPTDRAP